MSLGGVLAILLSNKDKQAAITVVVEEREEREEKKSQSWVKSLCLREEEEKRRLQLQIIVLERLSKRNKRGRPEQNILEIKNKLNYNLFFDFDCLSVFLCLQSEDFISSQTIGDYKTGLQQTSYQTSQHVIYNKSCVKSPTWIL